MSGLFPHSFHCRWGQLVTAAEMDKTVPGHENFSAPESVLTTPVRGDVFDCLLLQFLSGQGRQLSPDDWSALEEAEHHLYWLRALAGGH